MEDSASVKNSPPKTAELSVSRPGSACEIWYLRALERESAFLYTVLESHEGVVAYSTVPSKVPGYCELELIVPLSRKPEALLVLDKMKADIATLMLV